MVAITLVLVLMETLLMSVMVIVMMVVNSSHICFGADGDVGHGHGGSDGGHYIGCGAEGDVDAGHGHGGSDGGRYIGLGVDDDVADVGHGHVVPREKRQQWQMAATFLLLVVTVTTSPGQVINCHRLKSPDRLITF